MEESSRVLGKLMDKRIDWKSIESKPDYLGRTRRIGELFFMTPSTWQLLKGTPFYEAYNNHRFEIRHRIEEPDNDYFSVEFFQSRSTKYEKVENEKIKVSVVESVNFTPINNVRYRDWEP